MMQMSDAKVRIGIFVISGLALLLAALYVFGMGNFFKKQAVFVTVFSESVQGLSVGSPVKYKGVPVGSVSSITIQMQNKLIRVEMKIDEDSFIQKEDTAESSLFFKFFDQELKNGLRARLEMSGITGLRYVELNTFEVKDNSPFLPYPGNLSDDELYIPSTPSLMTDVMDTLSTALDRISQVQFDRISGDLTASLGAVRTALDGPEFTALLSNVERSSASVAKLTDRLDRQLEKVDAASAVDNFSGAMLAVTKFSSNADDTLFRFNRAIDIASALLEFLLNDPSALIRGRTLPRLNLSPR